MKCKEQSKFSRKRIISKKDLLELRGGTMTPECFPLSTWECTCKGTGQPSVLGTITFEGNIDKREEGCFETVTATCYGE